MARWHEVFEDAIRDLTGAWTAAEKFALASGVLRPEIFLKKLHLTWLTREPQPGFAYALNRYLVALLAGLADSHADLRAQFVRQRLMEIDKIRPATAGHACVSAGLCLGELHDVVLKPVDGGQASTEQANMLIIRHGTEAHSMLGGPQVREQMLPYDVPQ